MGLDMYLTKQTYIYSKQRENKDNVIKIEGIEHINPKKVNNIEEELGYWRKANAIHGWFMANVMDNEDDSECDVSEKQCQQLLDTCKKVLASTKLVKGMIKNGQKIVDGKLVDVMEEGEYLEDSTLAQELLPTTEGFFFGGKDYDQYYWADLEETVKIMTEAVEACQNGCSIRYSASW